MGQHLPEYSVMQIALFAQYREKRAVYRPTECAREGKCWVELGPPGLDTRGICKECRQSPGAEATIKAAQHRERWERGR